MNGHRLKADLSIITSIRLYLSLWTEGMEIVGSWWLTHESKPAANMGQSCYEVTPLGRLPYKLMMHPMGESPGVVTYAIRCSLHHAVLPNYLHLMGLSTDNLPWAVEGWISWEFPIFLPSFISFLPSYGFSFLNPCLPFVFLAYLSLLLLSLLMLSCCLYFCSFAAFCSLAAFLSAGLMPLLLLDCCLYFCSLAALTFACLL